MPHSRDASAGRSKRLRKMSLLALAVLVLGLVLSACGGGDDSSGDGNENDPINFGFSVGLSGLLEAFDGPILETAKIAIKEINEEGGIDGRQVKFDVVDNGSDPSKSGTAATELLEGGADVIFTSCDYDIGGPAARVAGESGKVAIGCAGSELYGVQGIGPNTYNTYPGASAEGASLAQFAIDNGWKTAYTMTDTLLQITKDQCKYFKETYEELGGKIVGETTFANEDPSVSTQVQKMQSAGPDVTVLCSLPPGGASALKQIRAVEPTMPVMSGDGMDGTAWTEAIPSISDYYVVTVGSTSGEDPSEQRKDLYAAYEKETGEASPIALTILGAAAVETIRKGIEKAGSVEGEELEAALDTFSDEPLLTGETTYTPECHISSEKPMVINRYDNGKLKYDTTVDPSFVPKTIC